MYRLQLANFCMNISLYYKQWGIAKWTTKEDLQITAHEEAVYGDTFPTTTFLNLSESEGALAQTVRPCVTGQPLVWRGA